MKIDLNTSYSRPQFQRRPVGSEVAKYTKTVSKGLQVLDKKLGLIVHNSSVPSTVGKNIGIGSLLSKTAQASFLPFLAMHAYSTIQQEPDNVRGPFKPSPYIPISSSKNTYMAPLEKLATEEYAEILTEKDLQSMYKKNAARKSPNKVDYNFIYKNYTELLDKAYDNFSKRVTDWKLDESLIRDYIDYSQKNYEELEANAIYEVLAVENKDEDWKQWKKESHRKLYSSEYKSELEQIKKEHASDIEKHIFRQWFIDREVRKSKALNETLGIKVIGDSPVALPTAEVWRNQELYFDDFALGCAPDYFSPEGQRWGFAMLKPETLFNPDGTLGSGGELMKKRYEKMFEASPGGVRIDHIIGLIDPFVYTVSEPKMTQDNSGRLYSSPDNRALGKYAKRTEEEYAAILEKIVIPAAEKFGLSKDDIICEDLGTVTDPVTKIMSRLNLSGIAVTQYDYRGKDQGENKIIMPGSHDNSSFLEYTDRMFSENERNHLQEKSLKLAQDTAPQGANIDAYKNEIASDKKKFMTASFAELFTSPAKRVQMFFTDFFGIGETYNQPGKEDGCWALRAPENFEEHYYSALQKGTALNLPEVLAIAIRQKGAKFADDNKDLLKSLDEFTKILKS